MPNHDAVETKLHHYRPFPSLDGGGWVKGKGGCAGDLRPTQASLDGAPELLGLVMGGAPGCCAGGVRLSGETAMLRVSISASPRVTVIWAGPYSWTASHLGTYVLGEFLVELAAAVGLVSSAISTMMV